MQQSTRLNAAEAYSFASRNQTGGGKRPHFRGLPEILAILAQDTLPLKIGGLKVQPVGALAI